MRKVQFLLLCLILVFASLYACSDKEVKQEGKGNLVAATGLSLKTDSRAAGQEAAQKAKAKLNGKTPKLVLVFSKAQNEKEMLKGVALVFPKKVIYGSSVYDPITEAGNSGTVGLLALTGDINISATTRSVAEGKEFANGKKIARKIKRKITKDKKHLLIVLGQTGWGKTTPLPNEKLSMGIRSVLGKYFPVIGGSAAQPTISAYYKGRIKKNSNIAILISGNFEMNIAARTSPREADKAVSAAGEATKTAVNGKKPSLVFAFNCGGRRKVMLQGNKLKEELTEIKKSTGDSALIGFYGGGEIGPNNQGEICSGRGFHIIVAALR